MAHFIAKIKGQRGEASRLGNRNSGIHTTTASWEGAVSVTLTHENGRDMARVTLTPWHGSGTTRMLYEGPVSGALDKQ